jgi:hypothetical protein
MALLPDGVSTCDLLVSPSLDMSGRDVPLQVIVTPSHAIVWSATGDRLEVTDEEYVIAAGFGDVRIPLPHTDQPGFVDANDPGQQALHWYYNIKVTPLDPVTNKARPSYTKLFQPEHGLVEQDLDLLPLGVAYPWVSVPIGNGIPIIVLEFSDPVPAGLPPNTLIFRKAA